jgi:Uncharacterized conserved protein (DUF2285)/Family of unknown function (DUF6499)
MPQVRKTGTAWECCLDDYAYTLGLDHMGWAWEFLRRNEDYKRDYRTNRAGHPLPIIHNCGAVVVRLRRRVLAAERWGLHLFADPYKSARDAHVFWLTERLKNAVSCTLRIANDNEVGALNLASFMGQRRVLVTPNEEFVVIADHQMSACMVVKNTTFLINKSAVTFEILGLEDQTRTFDAVNNLRRLQSNGATDIGLHSGYRTKYFDYLLALDGHLAGRSYRDIAAVLYGSDCIGPCWTDDSRGYKSKVRRAVRSGLVLMNGGYRALL